jgi:hypothetical protein
MVPDRKSKYSLNVLSSLLVLGFVFLVFAAEFSEAKSTPEQQQSTIQKRDLAGELQAYFNAEFAMLRAEQAMELQDQRYIAQLEILDLSHRRAWEEELRRSRRLYAERVRYIDNLETLRRMETKKKDARALRKFIENDSDGALPRWRREQKLAAQADALNRSLKAMVQGYDQDSPNRTI